VSLLFGTCYDPATAVSKATTALLAMTAIDTTNLRANFTVPANGSVMVRMAATLHGATSFPQILLGVLNGASVVKRVSPAGLINGTALATTFLTVEALFAVTGLTAASAATWDAAYGVETLVASTGLKYGGPNDAVADNAWGGFVFEIWST